MRSTVVVALLLLSVSLLTGTRSEYLSIKQKFQSIENQKLKPGTRVALPSSELNAYVQAELPKVAPQGGIRNPSVDLQGNNVAIGRAIIDFVKIQNAQGPPPNWMLKRLLDGEHQVVVTAQLNSHNGYATVDLKRVEVDGLGMQGPALDYLVRNYLMPKYPNAKIGTPFKLDYKMERLEVTPGVAYVIVGKN